MFRKDPDEKKKIAAVTAARARSVRSLRESLSVMNALIWEEAIELENDDLQIFLRNFSVLVEIEMLHRIERSLHTLRCIEHHHESLPLGDASVMTRIGVLQHAIPVGSAAAWHTGAMIVGFNGTHRRAAVAAHDRTVVAFLSPFDRTVSANGNDARIETCIRIDSVAVVALFVLLLKAVAAERRLTDSGAGIVIVLVAVVTLLGSLQITVRTGGEFACDGAGVRVDLVRIITLFRTVDLAVTAEWPLAKRGAGIGIDLVAIVTLLAPLLKSIAADGRLAECRTHISVIGIAVIALLCIRLPVPVSAERKRERNTSGIRERCL